jgi:hypothetical protein
MVVPKKRLKTEVVVVEIPQFDAEVGRTRSDVSALMVIGDKVDGV